MYQFQSAVDTVAYKMYKLTIFSILLVATYALPNQFVRILGQDQVLYPDGSYKYGYETENGIQAVEQGIQKQLPEGSGTAAEGFFRYTAPSGEPIELRYVADENGFRAEGNAVPQPPPIPPLILKALQWIEAHPEPEQRVLAQNQYYQ
ncbi:endocuticle structural glycoprotein SgAbd-4-like [Leptinotarsa decemlineata]|uniref:endocuticle structural glycoprotein SgAbd-4-like n=1 Tax=Leptinotarsa decemlineata TaxID=7539 RepID=UPI003D307FC2